MSFFGSGSGSGAFGQQNTQQTTGFGGFGSNTNTTSTGFGGSGTGFGAAANTATPSTGLFGGSSGTGFGAGTSGFGSSAFGAKPATAAFGTPATTSGGLFGSSTTTAPATSGFGAFGGNATSTTTPAFGSGGGLFGGTAASKPATIGFSSTPASTGFGSGTTLFGSGNTSTTPAFGATNNPGIGTNVGDPPGTGSTPFNAFTDKEGTSGITNHYQNILFQEPYRKFSTEELRLADYNQGRKTGGMGGTGAFGASNFGAASTGFGSTAASGTGFGATAGGGLFGGGAAGGGFGTNTSTASAFGSTPAQTAGGLFGQKPAQPSGGLFGSTTPAQQPATSGLFGATSTPSGFGSTGTNAFGSTATNTASGGLFGSTAAKPATGGLFGGGAAGGGLFGGGGTANTATGFGSTPAANTGTGGGLFGNTASTGTTGGGLFGTQNQQQPAAGTGFGTGTTFGGANQTTGGLFGNTAKPAGAFGSTPAAPASGTGGGLFGASTTTASPFGGNTAQPAASSGLFGKPAGGGGLFGGSTTSQPATGGGLFGSTAGANQQPQQQAGGLFGGGAQQAKPGGLFGSTQNSGGLFGSTNTAPASGGLFGSSTTQQQTGGLGGSIFGNSQNQQQPQAFSTSINDISAYGASTLFTNLADDKVANPGPLATPLSGKPKTRSRSILPMYKLSPANASRLATPRKQGYGFSYSAYGSPSSPSSAASTPGGLGQSLLTGSIGRSGLSKSISASNLRRSFNVEDSILSPGAFSSSSGPRLLGSSNTHKKLVINRDLRADLFTTPAKDKQPLEINGKQRLSKRVSFETTPAEVVENGQDTIRESIEGGSTPGEEFGFLKPNSTLKSAIRSTNNGVNGSQPPSVTATPDMQQVKGNELAIVPEEASPEQTRSSAKRTSSVDPITPGTYWMTPTVEEIRAMNRVQRSKVNLIVGREKVGCIEFKVPVDLNNVDFEHILDEIVVLTPRSATVYPVTAKKPVVGKGLNVPARISLENSYPRGGHGVSESRLRRHIEKLKAIPDTTFEEYNKDTGVWTFSVEHFTTYGLDDDEEEDEVTEMTDTAPASSATKHSLDSPAVDPDDTFEFKRSKRAVPGAFDEDAIPDEELLDNAPPQGMSSPEINDGDVPVQSQDWYDDQSMQDEQDVYQQDVEQGSQDDSIEENDDLALGRITTNDAALPGGILRARMRAVKKSTAPTRIEVAGGDDWTQILQASVRAPRTVDRVALRALNESGAVWEMQDRGSPAPKSQPAATDGAGFQTSIDLMKSLFEKPKGHGEPGDAASLARGFVKWPYQKRDKVDAHENEALPPRPTWGPNELFVATQHNQTNILPVDGSELGSEITQKQLSQLQQFIDMVSNSNGGSIQPSFRELAQDDPVWELASLLFENHGANLAAFWKQMVSDTTDAALERAETHEEKAIICLAGHRVADACAHLMEAKNFRLAGLVASIGSGKSVANDIRAQLSAWRESSVLSEISEPIRAIYELLGGNACVCDGVKNVSIENRVSSFTISKRFGLDWQQAFGLRLFYPFNVPDKEKDAHAGWGTRIAEVAVRSFAADVDQDREPEPDHALWSLLRIFAFRQFDWSDPRLGWLLTKSIYATGQILFGPDAEEKLDMACLQFAAALTSAAASSSSAETKNLWVQAAFVLGNLSSQPSKEAAVREHLGRHAHLIGSRKDSRSPFAAILKFSVPEEWIWEAKALHFRSEGDARQEFLALVWAGNYREANTAFVERVAPAMVIAKDFDKLFSFARLLFKVGMGTAEWEGSGANVYLLYPMGIAKINGGGGKGSGVGLLGDDDRLVGQLLDGLVALRAQSHGDILQEAAIADMAESLLRAAGSGYFRRRDAGRGGDDQKLYGLLPEDVRGKYLRARALEIVC